MFKGTKKVINVFLRLVSLLDITQWLLTGGAWVVVIMLEQLINAPTWFYTILIVITIVIGTVSIINIVFRYKRWLRISYVEDTQIAEILVTLRKLHENSVTIARNIEISQFTNDPGWHETGETVMDIWNIPVKDIPSLFIKRKIDVNKILGIVSAVMSFDLSKSKSMRRLLDMSGLLENYGKGINAIKKDDGVYNDLLASLGDYRAKLSISNEKVSEVIDNTLIYSYCICSLLLYSRINCDSLKHIKIEDISGSGITEKIVRKLLYKLTMQLAVFDGLAEQMINKKLETVRAMIKGAAIQ